ncbi:hypothetical protein ACQKWADRAFT_289882 [Trichoderma austrokoningii]
MSKPSQRTSDCRPVGRSGNREKRPRAMHLDRPRAASERLLLGAGLWPHHANLHTRLNTRRKASQDKVRQGKAALRKDAAIPPPSASTAHGLYGCASVLFPAASFLTLLPTPWSCMTRGHGPCRLLLQQGFASRQPPMSSKHPLHHHIKHTLRWIPSVQALFSSSRHVASQYCHTACTLRTRGQTGPGKNTTTVASSMPLISFASYSHRDAPFAVLLC